MTPPERIKYLYNGAEAVTDFRALELRFREHQEVDRAQLRTVLATYVTKPGAFPATVFDEETAWDVIPEKLVIKPIALGQDNFSLVFRETLHYPPLFTEQEYRISDQPLPLATIHSDIITYFDRV